MNEGVKIRELLEQIWNFFPIRNALDTTDWDNHSVDYAARYARFLKREQEKNNVH